MTELRLDPVLSAVSAPLSRGLGFLRAHLPAGLVRFGRRDPETVLSVDAEGGLSPSGSVDTSWLGHTSRRTGPSEAASRLLVLPEAMQFRRTVSLSRQVVARGRRSVGLRVADLSPLPPADTVFAYEILGETSDGRCEVKIAIARRRDIDALLSSMDGGDRWRVVGSLDESGRTRFQFDAGRPWDGALGVLRRGAIIYVAALLAIFAWAGHVERQASAARTHQSELIAQIRDVRGQAEALDTLLASGDQARLPVLIEAAATASEQETRLASLQRVLFRAPGAVELTGQTAGESAETVTVRVPAEAEE